MIARRSARNEAGTTPADGFGIIKWLVPSFNTL